MAAGPREANLLFAIFYLLFWTSHGRAGAHPYRRLQRRQGHALNDPGLDPVNIELQRLIGGLKERIGAIGEGDL